MNTRIFGTCGVLIVLAVFAIYVNSRRGSPPPKIRDLSGGARVQRQRIDRAIATAGDLQIEDAISSLKKSDESYALVGLARLDASGLGYKFVNGILADRRISKIYEHLLSLSFKEANSKSQMIFDQHFANFISEWQKFAREGGVPNTDAAHHAASAGLFFCSCFCEKEILDSKIQTWNSAIKSLELEKSAGASVHNPSLVIDRLYHLNLLVISGHRNGRSINKLNNDLDVLCKKINGNSKPFLQVSQLRLFKWNAETLDTDFTHRTRGVPASGSEVLVEIPGFADSKAWLYLERPEVVEQCIDCIKSWRDK